MALGIPGAWSPSVIAPIAARAWETDEGINRYQIMFRMCGPPNKTVQATVDYCKTNLPRICRQFGGDLESVFICGFSRGAIGASYIGLADDEIASFWKGMITHDHFDGDTTWGYPESDRKSALVRLARLEGRPVLACGGGNDFVRDHPELGEVTILRPPVAKIFKIPEGKVIHPHTDLWMHRESRYREQARQWLNRHK